MRKTLIAFAALVALTLGSRAVNAGGGKHAHHAKRVEISVTEGGFAPDKISVKRDQPVILAITRKTDKTCATNVVVRVSKEKTVKRDLPLGKTVEIPVTFAKTGELSYACGMGHVAGVIQVQ